MKLNLGPLKVSPDYNSGSVESNDSIRLSSENINNLSTESLQTPLCQRDCSFYTKAVPPGRQTAENKSEGGTRAPALSSIYFTGRSMNVNVALRNEKLKQQAAAAWQSSCVYTSNVYITHLSVQEAVKDCNHEALKRQKRTNEGAITCHILSLQLLATLKITHVLFPLQMIS